MRTDMQRALGTVSRVLTLWRSMGTGTAPTYDKDYFLTRLAEISKTENNERRGIYKCNLRWDLARKYLDSGKEGEIVGWLLEVIQNERSDLDFVIEAMDTLEQINWERAIKELKHYENDSNLKIRDKAISIITCHLSQIFEREFTQAIERSSSRSLQTSERKSILQPYIEQFGQSLVEKSLADVTLWLNHSQVRLQALNSLREINPNRAIDILNSVLEGKDDN